MPILQIERFCFAGEIPRSLIRLLLHCTVIKFLDLDSSNSNIRGERYLNLDAKIRVIFELDILLILLLLDQYISREQLCSSLTPVGLFSSSCFASKSVIFHFCKRGSSSSVGLPKTLFPVFFFFFGAAILSDTSLRFRDWKSAPSISLRRRWNRIRAA